jgi:hypothetical protein
MAKMKVLVFAPLLLVCAIMLVIVSLVAVGEWRKQKVSLCSSLLSPKAYNESTERIARVERLPRSFGSLAVFARRSADIESPRVLYVHGLQGNSLHYSDTIETLLAAYPVVHVLEPRGYGVTKGQANLRSVIIAVREAFRKLGRVDMLIGESLGANCSLFAIVAFGLEPRHVHWISRFDWGKFAARVPGVDHCHMGVLSQWDEMLRRYEERTTE